MPTPDENLAEDFRSIGSLPSHPGRPLTDVHTSEEIRVALDERPIVAAPQGATLSERIAFALSPDNYIDVEEDSGIRELRELLQESTTTSFVGAQPVSWLMHQLCIRIEDRAQRLRAIPDLAKEWTKAVAQSRGRLMMLEPREDDIPALGRLVVLAEHFLLNQEAGQLTLVLDPDGDDGWTVAMTFGQEAPDSDMAGGAAYGTGTTAADALREALHECGESV